MKLNKTKNKSDGAAKSKSGNTTLKKVIALFLTFFTMVLLLSELATFTLYAVPMIGIQMFQMTGIGIESGLTLSAFTVSDMSVMFMMWIMPCIFFIGISIYLHCKLIRLVFKKIANWLSVIFNKSVSVKKD